MLGYLITFFISMLPVIELRGSIPVAVVGVPGLFEALDPIPAAIVSVIGNMLPVPFILLFIRRILQWMKGTKRLAKIANWIESRAHKKSDRVQRSASLGLLLFVAIPLPGTGAWTGSIIAALLDMRMKYALPAVFAGVLIASVIVTLICTGVLGFLSWML